MKQLIKQWQGLYFFLRRIKSGWRRWKYKLSGVDKDCYLGRGCTIDHSFVAGPYSLVNDYCFIGPGVSIGAYTMLAPQVGIVGSDHRFDIVGTPTYFSGRAEAPVTKIGRDVWIGFGAVVKLGVTIEDGAIIAAGSIITKDVGACEIHGGVPGKKMRDRFENEADRDTHLDKIRNLPVKDFDPEKRLRLLI